MASWTIVASLLVLWLGLSLAEAAPSFLISNNTFFKDGKPFRIFGGEMHYFRIVPQYWEDRLMRAKSMGLNTIQTYIPWNIHEPAQGSFYFEAEFDVEAYIRLAHSLGLLVMLRIGPYTCGEWDFGGFPAWLLSKQQALELRSSDSAYLGLVEGWWDVLLPKLHPFFYSQGGPIIMLQIENEYGSYGNDANYLHYLVVLTRKHVGEDIILYTTDGATKQTLSHGNIVLDNVYAAVDFSTGEDPAAAFALQKKYNLPGKSPPLTTEFYTGWLTHWGEKLARTDANETAVQLKRVLAANGSVVLYMAHGGSNFGFYSGANTGDGPNDYRPDITSYDYDAPIGEAGDITEKFNCLRNVFTQYISARLPTAPELPPREAYGILKMQRLAPLLLVLDVLSHGQTFQEAVTMEALGQAFGFVVYQTVLPSHAKPGSVLRILKVHDRAQAFVGASRDSLTPVGTIERWSNSSLTFPSGTCPGLQLWILVENMGRVNYGPYIYDQKGILSPVLLDNVSLVDWTIYPVDLSNAWTLLDHQQHTGFKSVQKNLAFHAMPGNTRTTSGVRKHLLAEPAGPWFYSANFQVDSPADTFISFKGWNKGVAFVNGINLGRFWPAAGPQCTLYVPGPLLKPGDNRLTILELDDAVIGGTVEFKTEHDWSCSPTEQSKRLLKNSKVVGL